MPNTDKLTRLSDIARSLNLLLSEADMIDEALIAAKLSDCAYCIELRIQEVEKKR